MASDILERKKIIDQLDKNLIVSASAGSGKTTILVERMVALVEQGKVELSKMAALTFTKKAANEFYDRFYKKLQLRVRDDFDIKIHDEYSLLGMPTEEGKRRDKEALKQIDTCFFGTIDAFYQKILNEHPLEAGLSCNSTIITEEEFTNFLIKKFSEYSKSNDQNLQEKAVFFGQLIGASQFPGIATTVLNNRDLDIDQIPDSIDKLEKTYKSLIVEFKKGCEILVQEKDYFRTLKPDGTDATDKNGQYWDYLLEHINEILYLKDDDYRTANRLLRKIGNLAFSPDNHGLIACKCNFISLFTEPRNFQSIKGCLQINNYLYSVLNKIIYYKIVEFLNLVKDDIYNSLKDSGLLTFSMATDCLLDLLRNDKAYKTTIEDIRNKIGTLLIDECQDTDMKQYEIFFRLTATDYKDRFEELNIPGGKLYACGDRKQGIYHFRGADVSTYDHIKQIFEDNKIKKLPFDLITLTDNHRSNEKLINYFNRIFKNVLASQGYSPIQNDQVTNPCSVFGAYKYLTSKATDPDNVAKLILQMCDVYGYTFRDFMVMTANKDSIMAYSKKFAELSIPSYSEGKIDIYVSPLLDVVINLFKYFGSNKKDLIAYFEILSSPLFKFDITKTVDTSIDYLATLGIPQNKPICPSDLLETLASNEKVIKALNCKGIDVLIGFIHLLKYAENSGEIVCYADAIQYFVDLQKQDKIVERLSLLGNDIDAVQIANAHKTKGLEKKVVILTKAGTSYKTPNQIKSDKLYIIHYDASWGQIKYPVLNNPSLESPLIAQKLENEKIYGDEENKRLLYVAATRARDFLFISDELTPKGASKADSRWYPLIDGLKYFTIEDNHPLAIQNVDLAIKPKNNSFNNEVSFKYLSPSKQDGYVYKDDEIVQPSTKNNDALDFGSMVHKLLENIVKAKNYVLDDKICDQIGDEFNRVDLVESLQKVKETIYKGGYPQKQCPFNDILSAAKDSNCYTEVPVSYLDGDKVITGNIDLVLDQKDKVVIIDYKTDVHDVDHSKQLGYYKDALSKFENFKNRTIEAFIYNIRK